MSKPLSNNAKHIMKKRRLEERNYRDVEFSWSSYDGELDGGRVDVGDLVDRIEKLEALLNERWDK